MCALSSLALRCRGRRVAMAQARPWTRTPARSRPRRRPRARRSRRQGGANSQLDGGILGGRPDVAAQRGAARRSGPGARLRWLCHLCLQFCAFLSGALPLQVLHRENLWHGDRWRGVGWRPRKRLVLVSSTQLDRSTSRYSAQWYRAQAGAGASASSWISRAIGPHAPLPRSERASRQQASESITSTRRLSSLEEGCTIGSCILARRRAFVQCSGGQVRQDAARKAAAPASASAHSPSTLRLGWHAQRHASPRAASAARRAPTAARSWRPHQHRQGPQQLLPSRSRGHQRSNRRRQRWWRRPA